MPHLEHLFSFQKWRRFYQKHIFIWKKVENLFWIVLSRGWGGRGQKICVRINSSKAASYLYNTNQLLRRSYEYGSKYLRCTSDSLAQSAFITLLSFAFRPPPSSSPRWQPNLKLKSKMIKNKKSRKQKQRTQEYDQKFTLKTRCNIICKPALPGYFPAIFAAVKLNRFAPVSVQIASISIFLPQPRGPAIMTDLMCGAFSWTIWDPVDRRLYKVEQWKKFQTLGKIVVMLADWNLVRNVISLVIVLGPIK